MIGINHKQKLIFLQLYKAGIFYRTVLVLIGYFGGPMISNKNTVSHPKSLSKQMTKSTTSEGNSTLLSVWVLLHLHIILFLQMSLLCYISTNHNWFHWKHSILFPHPRVAIKSLTLHTMTTDKLVLKTDELDSEINSFNFYLVY